MKFEKRVEGSRVSGVSAFLLRKGFEDTVELAAAAGKSGNNILGGRLKESHNVGDKFVLALDCCKSVELISTEVNGFFNVCCLKSRKHIVLLHKVLDELGRCVSNLGAHQRSGACQCGIQFGVITFKTFESLAEKSILYYHELNISLGASATKVRSLLCVQTGSLNEVEVRILLQELGYIVYDKSFIFFFRFATGLRG